MYKSTEVCEVFFPLWLIEEKKGGAYWVTSPLGSDEIMIKNELKNT